MTICIAIACDCLGENAKSRMVLVADLLLSTGITSTEIGLKARPLYGGWNGMYAGNDISLADPILRAAAQTLRKLNEFSENTVMKTMQTAYRKVREQQIESSYLSSYGWKMEQFLQQGRAAFPESHYLNLIYEIERFDLQCQFLVSGFDPNSELPCIFEVRHPGVVIPIERLMGYGAIGSGATNAISYLARRDQGIHLSLAQSVYNGVAAKNLAEKALGVGTRTMVMIVEPGNETPSFLSHEQIAGINQIWREEADFKPKDLEARASKYLPS